MKLAILCLCLASTASAAPSFFHYLPHYGGPRQQVAPAPSQVKTPFTAPQTLTQPGLVGGYSVELLFPHRLPGTPGANTAQPFPSHGFIKYSIPQPPGRQSVEVYYPYDFSQQRILTNIPPLTNVPHLPSVLPFEIPAHIPNVAVFDSPPPSQDPLPPLQQDQPTQTSQVPEKV